MRARAAAWGSRALDLLPAQLAGAVDLRRPASWQGFGGPMNGQRVRLGVVARLLTAGVVEAVVETGSYRGTTTDFLANVSGLPVHSCDVSERALVFARRRLAHLSDVHLVHASSPDFLRSLAAAGAGSATTFFYLDAHWEHYLPLADELALIAESWPRAVVLIDDIEVPGDPGYGCDGYAEGSSLRIDYLDTTAAAAWPRWSPPVPSAQETGARRGWVVLASPDDERLADLVEGAMEPARSSDG